MSATEWYLVALRVAHTVAAVVWLGGGVYYLIALRPAMREGDAPPEAFVAHVQRNFGEWARLCTLVMLATGVVLIFERLSNTTGGLLYVALLVLKVVVALTAFWLAGMRPGRTRSSRNTKRSAPEAIVGLGFLAYVLGMVLSTIWGRDFG